MNYTFSFTKQNITNNTTKEICFENPSDISYTFWNTGFLSSCEQEWPSNEALDLLYISLAVFAADRLTLRSSGEDAWSRKINLSIPVLSFRKFNNLKGLIDDMLSFLTGDYWSIDFSPRDFTQKEIIERNKFYKKRQKLQYRQLNTVCMFSGGLDSFIGAIDLLETTSNKDEIMFISHYGGGKGTKEYQDVLRSKFTDYYELTENTFKQYYAKVINGAEDTTRSRSLLFFAHAIAVASTFNKEVKMIVPENGYISLNIPLNYSRIGSSSTRTTHPYYMKMLQNLLDKLGISVKLVNPYQFKTKGEMIIDCKNQEFLKENISFTMSCAHPDIGRYRGIKQSQHCGYCLPCIVRQAAFKRAKITDKSLYYDSSFSSGDEAKTILKSYRLGFQKFNPKYAFMTIQQNGLIDNNIEAFTDLYVRGIQEIKAYIEEL